MKNERMESANFFNAKMRYIRLAVDGALFVAFGIFLAAKRQPEAFYELAASAALIIFEFFHIKKSKTEFLNYVEQLDFCLNSNTQGSLLNYPAPLVITDMSGRISWYNEWFKKALGKDELFGLSLQEQIPELQISKLVENEEKTRINLRIGENHYEVWGNVAKSGKKMDENSLIVLYFIDKTAEVMATKQREDERVIECIVIIDNYDEVLKETPDSNHGTLVGEIKQKINAWVALGDGVSREYERDKFIVFFSSKSFEKIMENKFAVLDEVRGINHENKIPVTLSIGVGKSDGDITEGDRHARLAIDMALGRGGDQVVIRDSANFTFFGAKTREVEKRTKVKARVVAHALRELIDHAGKVIIMGHKNSDLDSLGAAIGLFKAVKSRGGNPYIVVDKDHTNARLLLNEFEKLPEYEDAFITGEQALNIYGNDSLVIVVDVHRPGMVECPELLQHTSNVALIDHHRRSEDFIDKAVLTYHEPYASSTCEMITEILQYLQDNERLSQQEAEALYAGIFMDTKGFTFKTGVRTYEAASYLRRMGGNPVEVRRLFKTNLESYVARADIIRRARLYRGSIALSFLYDERPDMTVIAAQAADELLNISGVEASFVLVDTGTRIAISGRSLDSINVQVILEKLGGGGHITIAGAQLEDTPMEDAVEQLKAAIDSALDE